MSTGKSMTREESLDQNSPGAGDGDTGNDELKPIRACHACRTSKVACIQPNDGQTCVRCDKTGKLCIPTHDSTKKLKRSHSRSVAKQHETNATWSTSPSSQGRGVSRTVGGINAAWQKQTAAGASSPDPTTLNSSPRTYPRASAPSPSVNSGGSTASCLTASIVEIVDEDTADAIFREFTTNMLPEFPFVAFPQDTNTRDVCENSPITFLAILDAAANGFCETETTRRLRRLLVSTYSSISPGVAEVNVSVLQAFIISSCWNRVIHPPQPGEHIDVHQIIIAATGMAMLMGLGKMLTTQSWNSPMLPSETRRLRGPSSEYQISSLDARRIWLGCHYVSSNVSMALQTPNIMRWTRYMDECLEVLESSPASVPSDKVLCRHVRLQHILEDFELRLFASVTEPEATESAQTPFRRQLAAWAAASSTWTGPLRFSHHFVKLYMHEIAMYSARKTSAELDEVGDHLTIDPNDFTDCLEAAHGLLDVFLSLDMSLIRALPTVYFVRVIYAAIVLVKLHFAYARLPNPMDAAGVTKSLKVDDYLGRMLQKFSGWGTLWPAWRLTQVLRRVRELFRKNYNQRIEVSELSWLNSWAVGSSPSATAESSCNTNIEAIKTAPKYHESDSNDVTTLDDTLDSMNLESESPWNSDLIDISQLDQWLESNAMIGSSNIEDNTDIS